MAHTTTATDIMLLVVLGTVGLVLFAGAWVYADRVFHDLDSSRSGSNPSYGCGSGY